MPTFAESARSSAPPEEVWKLPYDPSRFPQWWAGVGTVEPSTQDGGPYVMYPDGYPDFPMPQLLHGNQRQGNVTISCLVSDLVFTWRLRMVDGGTRIDVHVEIPDTETHRMDTQREVIHRSVRGERIASVEGRYFGDLPKTSSGKIRKTCCASVDGETICARSARAMPSPPETPALPRLSHSCTRRCHR